VRSAEGEERGGAQDEPGGEPGEGEWTEHAALLDRLAAVRRRAEAAGWTSLALERDGAGERFRLFGVPPGGSLRTEVPE
jgi:hypothetical protein